MTTTRRKLLTLLTYVQNHITAPIDIMTITGFMDDEEVVKHTMYYARQLPAAQQSKLLEMTKSL